MRVYKQNFTLHAYLDHKNKWKAGAGMANMHIIWETRVSSWAIYVDDAGGVCLPTWMTVA